LSSNLSLFIFPNKLNGHCELGSTLESHLVFDATLGETRSSVSPAPTETFTWPVGLCTLCTVPWLTLEVLSPGIYRNFSSSSRAYSATYFTLRVPYLERAGSGHALYSDMAAKHRSHPHRQGLFASARCTHYAPWEVLIL